MANKAAPPGQSHKDRVSAFLSDLDDLAAAPPASSSSAGAAPGAPAVAASSSGTGPALPAPEDAQSVLDFLDEITQRSATPAAPVPKHTPIPRQESRTSVRSAGQGAAASRISTDSTRSGKSPVVTRPETPNTPAKADPVSPSSGGWGWSSVWNSASSVIQQARNVAEENIKALPQPPPAATESAQKWRQGVLDLVKNGVDVEKLRKELQESAGRTFTDIINAVAPPISEHEVIQVWLSHDMAGYDGVETLVYRALAKIMEQVEGGDLVVQRGNEEKPSAVEDEERSLNHVDGLTEAYKLAEADLDALIKKSYQPTPAPDSTTEDAKTHSKSNSITVPITYCPVYLRIQPCLAPLPFVPAAGPSDAAASADAQKHLFFLLLLRDPKHSITHRTLSQALPGDWLDIPFEENEWVEDNMVDVIRKGVETVGQAYIRDRQTATRPPAVEVVEPTPVKEASPTGLPTTTAAAAPSQ